LSCGAARDATWRGTATQRTTSGVNKGSFTPDPAQHDTVQNCTARRTAPALVYETGGDTWRRTVLCRAGSGVKRPLGYSTNKQTDK